MSMTPEQMQQMLAMYRAQFPGQVAANLGNAPAGTTKTAGAANGVSKLLLALMQQKAQQQYKQQYPTPPPTPVPTPAQGQTLSTPQPDMTGGGVGP